MGITHTAVEGFQLGPSSCPHCFAAYWPLPILSESYSSPISKMTKALDGKEDEVRNVIAERCVQSNDEDAKRVHVRSQDCTPPRSSLREVGEGK